MVEEKNYYDLFDKSISKMLGYSKNIFKEPRYYSFVLKTIKNQSKMKKIRLKNEKDGLHVPAMEIISITNRCNLRCKGCYNQNQKRTEKEMSFEKLLSVINESKKLGISIALLAGGEPFTRKEIFEIPKRNPEMIFPVFTNGLLIEKGKVNNLKKYKNLIPILSIEGDENVTDDRRGEGIYNIIQNKMKMLKENHVMFGNSFTITSENYDFITSEKYIKNLIDTGTKTIFFVEYVPVTKNTEHLMLNDEQRKELLIKVENFRKKYDSLFISFPGDEVKFGGCLSSGRGFIHISADGKLEPCPMAPYSDSDLNNMTLKEALKSRLLKEIRDHHNELETKGSCTLNENKEWIEELMKNK
ncbi:MAG: radical SAM/SPASM domain-containing protein [Thermotogota bacterium]